MHTKTNKKNSWMFWHQWLGILTCIGILLWAISGISHPIMSRLQPKPAAFAAPSAQFDLSEAVSVKTVLEQQGIAKAKHVSLAQFSGHDYYRVSVDEAQPARYFNVMTGEALENGDIAYAKYLAQHFTGKPVEEITGVELVTAFNDDYHEVNRLLPVWRVAFSSDQHLRAFIDTEQSRLGTLVNDTRYWLTQLFQFGHNWSFLNGAPVWQLWLAAAVLTCVLFSAFSGLYLYLKLGKSKDRPMRYWHRQLGFMVSLSALLLASSGLFHLIMSYQQHKVAVTLTVDKQSIAQLDESAWQKVVAKPIAKLDLMNDNGHWFWHVLPAAEDGRNQMPVAQVAVLANEADHAEHHPGHPHQGAKKKATPYLLAADSGEHVIKSIEDFAKAKAVSLAAEGDQIVKSTTWVTQFKNEYGFIFKRLPVIKVQMQDADNTRYYIEPITGALAAKVRDIDGLEGFVFAYIHKWSFQFINKDLRDILAVLFAFGNIVVAILGLILFFRQRKSNQYK